MLQTLSLYIKKINKALASTNYSVVELFLF